MLYSIFSNQNQTFNMSLMAKNMFGRKNMFIKQINNDNDKYVY